MLYDKNLNLIIEVLNIDFYSSLSVIYYFVSNYLTNIRAIYHFANTQMRQCNGLIATMLSANFVSMKLHYI